MHNVSEIHRTMVSNGAKRVLCLFMGVLPLWAMLPSVTKQQVIAVINDGTIFQRLVLVWAMFVSTGIWRRLASAIFSRIEWRSVPRSTWGRELEKRVWNKLFYSARGDIRQYASMQQAAARLLIARGLDTSAWSIDERATLRSVLENDSKSEQEAELNEAIRDSSRMCSLACVVGVFYCLGLGVFGSYPIWGTALACLLFGALALLTFRRAAKEAEDLYFCQMKSVCRFVIDASKSSESQQISSEKPDSNRMQDGSEEAILTGGRSCELTTTAR